MTRRTFCLTSAAPVVLAQQRRRPNVILLLTDDQGYGDLACHGNRWIRTPNLDRLHAQSVRFVDHHSDPLCAPTRAGILTGQYALSNGVTAATGGWSILRPGAPTIAEVLQRNGYRTGIFGKWHLGENYPMRPSDRGFDESVVCRSGGIAQAADYWGNDYFDDHYYANDKPTPYKGYCTDVFFGLAKQFVERNKDRPFFLYLPTNAPHDPYLVSERYSAPYKKAGIPSPAAEFYGMIENIDENLGQLQKLLTRLGIADDTVFLFMTDNGSSAGTPRPNQPASDWKGHSGGMRAAKGSVYDGGHRVPLFVHWPRGGFPAGRDVQELTCHLDLFPTIVELCALTAPEVASVDGRSLVPLLRGEARFPADRVHFIEHHQLRTDGKYQMERPRPWMNSVALSRDWRLVGGKELYRIKADPHQERNVAAEHPGVAKMLGDSYDRWWQRMHTGFCQWTRIPIGAALDRVELTCFDWHGDFVPSNQLMVTSGLVASGVWSLHAERPGRYDITLYQRPSYVPHKLEAERATVWLNGRELPPRPVSGGVGSVTFMADLPRGDVNLSTEFIDGTRRRGAYYADVQYIGSRKG